MLRMLSYYVLAIDSAAVDINRYTLQDKWTVAKLFYVSQSFIIDVVCVMPDIVTCLIYWEMSAMINKVQLCIRTVQCSDLLLEWTLAVIFRKGVVTILIVNS